MNDVECCDREQLPGFQWPDGTAFDRAFLSPVMQEGVKPYIANVDTKLMVLRVGNIVFPVTINDREYENSYVCSPYTATISYPLRELELVKLGRGLRWALRGLVYGMAPLLRGAQINKVVCVNNWLLSTNLYPEWNGDGLGRLTEVLCRHSPDRAILFRSLNRATNDELCERFISAGYSLVPSRQVYVFDGIHPDYLRKVDTHRDQKLLRTTPYTVVPHEALTEKDDEDVIRLYEMLYLKKYSYYNPQFTARLVRLWHRERLLEMFGLRSPDGQLHGVVGCFSRNGVMTSPLVGYDIALPQELGLYRMLAAIVLREAAQRAMTLNLSSGVAGFKRSRGGVPHIEYTAVYCDHLPRYRRAAWRALGGLLSQIGVRVLRKYQL